MGEHNFIQINNSTGKQTYCWPKTEAKGPRINFFREVLNNKDSGCHKDIQASVSWKLLPLQSFVTSDRLTGKKCSKNTRGQSDWQAIKSTLFKSCCITNNNSQTRVAICQKDALGCQTMATSVGQRLQSVRETAVCQTTQCILSDRYRTAFCLTLAAVCQTTGANLST
jgi:hypothetical protein